MDLPKRKQIRLSGYDYSKNGLYFITICTQNRKCIFGNINNVGADPCVRPSLEYRTDPCVDPTLEYRTKQIEMILNHIGKMVNKWLLKIPENFINVYLDIYQIMPNHLHLIIIIGPIDGRTHWPIFGQTHGSAPTGGTTTIGTIIQWFKTMVTNEYINCVEKYNRPPFNKRLFQRNYYEHIIRNETELLKIREYIKINPQTWERDRNNIN